ncbi:STAS domain-containing protein [Kitasatospora sp. NBC_00240]|uniref:STAS domain-containing protein n=1 Tax=Kitasatospora sp. NBC_00240 TaxID=2903567 RepID=UPI00339340A4
MPRPQDHATDLATSRLRTVAQQPQEPRGRPPSPPRPPRRRPSPAAAPYRTPQEPAPATPDHPPAPPPAPADRPDPGPGHDYDAQTCRTPCPPPPAPLPPAPTTRRHRPHRAPGSVNDTPHPSWELPRRAIRWSRPPDPNTAHRREAHDHRAPLHRDRPQHGPVIEAAGELDLAGAPILHTAIHRALATRPASPKLVIDLAAVTFCDSTGIDALLLARTETGRQGVTPHLSPPHPRRDPRTGDHRHRPADPRRLTPPRWPTHRQYPSLSDRPALQESGSGPQLGLFRPRKVRMIFPYDPRTPNRPNPDREGLIHASPERHRLRRRRRALCMIVGVHPVMTIFVAVAAYSTAAKKRL